MYEVEFIPANWLERSAWAASHSERLQVYSRPIQIERRWGARRATERAGSDRRTDNPMQPFELLELTEPALV